MDEMTDVQFEAYAKRKGWRNQGDGHHEVEWDLIPHLQRQREWSERTFGPGHRTKGVIDHIRKELVEIEQAPLDLTEWIDVVILALDGAWRAGHSPSDIVQALAAKQAKNEARTWPDWRTQSEDKAIGHIQSWQCPICTGWNDPLDKICSWSHEGLPTGRIR